MKKPEQHDGDAERQQQRLAPAQRHPDLGPGLGHDGADPRCHGASPRRRPRLPSDRRSPALSVDSRSAAGRLSSPVSIRRGLRFHRARVAVPGHGRIGRVSRGCFPPGPLPSCRDSDPQVGPSLRPASALAVWRGRLRPRSLPSPVWGARSSSAVLAPVSRRNTSSRLWRPARRSASGRSCSASHPVRAATRAGVLSASTRYSPGVDLARRRPRPARPARRCRCPVGAPKWMSDPPPEAISSAGVPAPTTWPRSMMTTRSASRDASSSSWVVSTTATPAVAQLADHLADDDAPGRVDAGGRLVEEGDAWAGPPAPAPATVAAARRPRVAATACGRTASRPDPPEQRRRGRAACRSRRRTGARPRPDVIVGYTPPDCSITPIRRRTADRSATGSRPRTRTRPVVGARYPSQRLDGRGLARTVRPQHGRHLAGVGGEAQSADRHRRAELHYEINHLDRGGHNRPRYRCPALTRCQPPGDPMIDIRLVRTDPDAVRAALERRGPGSGAVVDELAELDRRVRDGSGRGR